MATQLTASLFSGPKEAHVRSYKCSLRVSASLDNGVRGVLSAKIASTPFEQTKERISTLIHEAELSVSTYDTAWVAMVPSPHSLQKPCFPECVDWLLENQCSDGSWSRPHHHPLLQKDVLSSTLACVLALKKWGIGEEHINRGLRFVELNFTSAMETCQISPIGFDIVFPAMIEYSRDMLLKLNLDPTISNDLILKRDMELKRCRESHSVVREAYLAYVIEGMGFAQKWELVMKYQRKNGSLFNSPSATAAAFIGFPNTECLDYLRSALKKFVNTVPAVYPLAIYSKLCALDNLQRLGIGHHFMKEFQTVLDETYRFWLQGNEEIFMDASTCALAFRLLRANGYKVTSDQITKILQEYLSSSFCGHMKDIHTTLEFYRASEFVLSPDERDLEVQNLQLKCVLEQELSIGFTHSNLLGRCIDQEVNRAVEYPFYASMDGIDKRRNIEHYDSNNTRILKSSFCSPSFCNKDFLLLSVEDFNRCQAIHQKELRELERWVIENKLNELKFARSKAAYCYFSAAATIFDPELSDARLSWAKNGVLTTVVDDLFDVGGSIEELEQLIQLVKAWDVEISAECTSKNVQIIFLALKSTICELGDKGFTRQGRNVTNHIIEIWLDLMNAMMREAKWSNNNPLPTLNEYMNNAYVSFALGPIVLPTLYLVGPKLTEEMVQHSEYHNLFKLMSTCGRLLNDIWTCERELKDGKLNAIPLYVHNCCGKVTNEAAIVEMKSLIDNTRKELLRLILEGENSTIPKPCKDLFWHMCTVVHFFYRKDDGFTSQDMFRVVNTIIHEPIHLDELHGQPGYG